MGKFDSLTGPAPVVMVRKWVPGRLNWRMEFKGLFEERCFFVFDFYGRFLWFFWFTFLPQISPFLAIL